MTLIAVSQRVVQATGHRERRDALDQRWSEFLGRCGLLPVAVPNCRANAEALLDAVSVEGVLLTGGNDPAEYGGDAPERDEVERWLIDRAIAEHSPLFGVCRGMQMIQCYFGAELQPVPGHVSPRQTITAEGRSEEVNSYHRLGTTVGVDELEIWARADDGVIKGVRHRRHPIQGIMWHPERCVPFREADQALIGGFFRGPGRA